MDDVVRAVSADGSLVFVTGGAQGADALWLAAARSQHGLKSVIASFQGHRPVSRNAHVTSILDDHTLEDLRGAVSQLCRVLGRRAPSRDNRFVYNLLARNVATADVCGAVLAVGKFDDGVEDPTQAADTLRVAGGTAYVCESVARRLSAGRESGVLPIFLFARQKWWCAHHRYERFQWHETTAETAVSTAVAQRCVAVIGTRNDLGAREVAEIDSVTGAIANAIAKKKA